MIIGITAELEALGLMKVVIPIRLKNGEGYIAATYPTRRFNPNKLYPFDIRGLLHGLEEISKTSTPLIPGQYLFLGIGRRLYVGNRTSIRKTPEETLDTVTGNFKIIDIGWEGDYITFSLAEPIIGNPVKIYSL